MIFWKRAENTTSIGILDPMLPQTTEQCTSTFGGEWQELTETLVPEFRDAYTGNNNYDLDQCKAITKDRLRAERIPLLDEQDVLYMRAQETNADTSAIVAEKQRLRDITKLADACKNLSALSALSCKK
tara:strand:+ start:403 stop:786 length:384 start_codon:yes stop_codon:yes gene_type:complete